MNDDDDNNGNDDQQYEVDYTLSDSDRLIKLEVLLVAVLKAHYTEARDVRELRNAAHWTRVFIGLTFVVSVITMLVAFTSMFGT